MVKVYTKDNCGKCKMLKRWLQIKGVDYSEINISQDEDGYSKIVEANRTSLPQLEINNEFIDFNEYNEILDIV